MEEQVKEIYIIVKVINDDSSISFKPYKTTTDINTKINIFINKQKGYIETNTNTYNFELNRLCEISIHINKQSKMYIQLQDYTVAKGDIETVTIEDLIKILNEEL